MMRDKVPAFCREQQLLQPGDTVFCAVSGGADSMALLLLLHSLHRELEITVCAAHFNHNLRGAESDGDEAFVRAFCESSGIPCRFGSGDAAAYASENGLSAEEAARELRYAFFATLPGLVATAHTADDNAETVLMNLIRGSGLRGLCGIPPKRGALIRPMLSVTREEVLAYLRDTGTPWREDSSNSTDFCRRNRLRHHVLPLLREENPAFSQTVSASSQLLREENAYLEALAAREADRAARGDGWDCALLLELPAVLLRRALICLLQRHGIAVSLCHVDALCALLSHSGQLSLPGGWTAVQSCGTLQFSRQQPSPLPARALPVPGTLPLPELGLLLRCTLRETAPPPSDRTLLLDAGAVSGAITVRSRRTGDTLALPGGSRTLKRLMIDRKIPLPQRDLLPVLEAEGQILAVYPLGVSRDHLPKPGKPVLAIQFQTYE